MLASSCFTGATAIRHDFKVLSRGIAHTPHAGPDHYVLVDTHVGMEDWHNEYALLLRRHGDTRALSMGMVVHHHLISTKLEEDLFLGNVALQMYGKCGALQEARSILARMHQRDVFAWTFIISAYAHAGQVRDALQFYSQMQHEGVMSSSFTFVEILCAYGKANLLVEGQRVHAAIAADLSAPGIILENALLNFYGKCGHLGAAQRIFNAMEGRDVVSWNTMVTAYNEHEERNGARQLFQAMLQQGFAPNRVTYTCLCDTCISKEDLTQSCRFHSYIIGYGLDGDVDISNTIISMYIRCGTLDNAFSVFYGIRDPNVVSWTTLIAALAQQKLCKQAVELSQQMLLEGVLPNQVTFLNLISACATQEDVRNGRRLHSQVICVGYELSLSIGNALINLYGKCKELKMARALFDLMATHDEVSWNSLIAAYFLQEHSKEALVLLQEMGQSITNLDRITLISVLQSSANEMKLDQGKLAHAYICQSWDALDSVVGTALINMYAQGGTLDDAQAVFNTVADRSVILWTALISAYGQHGQIYEANQMFEHMKFEGFIPDGLAVSTILSACDGQGGLAQGKWMHACTLCYRTCSEPVSNALLSMYMNCGSLRDVENAFKKMGAKNVMAWNTIFTACIHWGQPKRVFGLFKQMLSDGVLPNVSIYASLLNACAALAALAEGRQIHNLFLADGFEPDIVLGTALVNFYGKCGTVEDAQLIFGKMPKRNVAAWNSIIAAYCQIGDIDKARQIFRQMQDEGVRPDKITFLTIVSSFSHAGLVDEALNYFLSMVRDYSLKPTVEHYNCLVDLFGRAGCLDKVEGMLIQASFEPDLHSWMSFLSACRVQVDVECGERVLQGLSKLKTANHAPQVLMSNIYAAAGRFEAAALVRNGVGVEMSCN